MPEETNTYLELLYPGSFYPEEQVEKVKHRSAKRALKSLPKGVFAFRFYDQISKTVRVGGEAQKVYGKRTNLSPTYYPEGKLFSVNDLKAEEGDYKILISNMECNNWKSVVRTRRGNFQPFDPNKDAII